ncbi:MAG: LysR family transcriptional regulator [Proteobacteria bacterium]|nr:LysR family transcriptional regulator [Pseudomonadota bacterium]
MNFKLGVRSKFWLEDESGLPVFGGGRGRILEKIDELGSIRAAAADMKMSYRAVWGKIKTTEERLGIKLVETSPGGGRNRGARLTPAARELLALFRELHQQGNEQADRLFNRLFTKWKT